MIMSEPIPIVDPTTPAGMLEIDLVKQARKGDFSAFDDLV